MENENLVDIKRKEHRQKFPALNNKHYLNFGAQGTMPDAALAAISQAYKYVQEHGPLTSGMFGWILNQMQSTRQILVEEFGGDNQSYALTQNTTEGCNIVLWGLDWHEGDVLLTTDSEHTGVVKAVLQICKRLKLKLEICKLSGLSDDKQILAAVSKSLDCRPRLFLASHVLWNTGKVLPIGEIARLCRSRGVKILADGAQSAGVLPLNMPDLEIDFYAITAHKWLCGPEGLGALYVAPASLAGLEPTFSGWRGAIFDNAGNPVDWAPGAVRFEVATAPFPLLTGLAEAIAVHRQFGNAAQRYKLIAENAARLKEYLLRSGRIRLLDEAGGSGLVSFVIEGAAHNDIVKRLESQGIILRTIPNPSCIRASVHYFSREEVDVLGKALPALIG